MKFFIILLSVLFTATIFGQGTAGEGAKFEYRFLIDMPTAGILEKGFVGATTDIMPFGTLIQTLEVGVYDDISFGISYGGNNIIGAGNPSWFELPGVNLRFRLFREALFMPALSIGFESQGKGEYFDSLSRYSVKSPGFFVGVTKNFAFLGYLSLHGTLNYSLETKDGDNFINLKAGFEKTLGRSLSFITEYDFALNDNKTDFFGKGNGYLNMGLRFSLGEGLTLGFDLRDILRNKQWRPLRGDRALKIEYIKSIF
jgi:hypothetical protein